MERGWGMGNCSDLLGDGGNLLGDGGDLLGDGGDILGDGFDLLDDGGDLLRLCTMRLKFCHQPTNGQGDSRSRIKINSPLAWA